MSIYQDNSTSLIPKVNKRKAASLKLASKKNSQLNRTPLTDLTNNNVLNFHNTLKIRKFDTSPISPSSPWETKRIKKEISLAANDHKFAGIRRKLAPNVQHQEQLIRQALNDLITTSPVLSQFMVSSSGIEELATPTKRNTNPAITPMFLNNDLNLLVSEFINNGVTPDKIFNDELSQVSVLPPLNTSLGFLGKDINLQCSIYRTLLIEFPKLQAQLDLFMNEIKNLVHFQCKIIAGKIIIVLIIPTEFEILSSFQNLRQGLIQNDYKLKIRTSTGRYQVKPNQFQLKDLILKILWEDVYFSQGSSINMLIEVPSNRNKPNDFSYESNDNFLVIIKTDRFYSESIVEYLEKHLQFRIL